MKTNRINLVLSFARKSLEKLPTVCSKLEQSDSAASDHGVRGEIMALVMTWVTFADDGGRDATNFMRFVTDLGVQLLVELCEAAIRLELWPLYEQCSKSLASLISDMSPPEVVAYLSLDAYEDAANGTPPSVACLQGCLSYLSLEKRLELDDIEAKAWQQASHGLWSEQRVLYFITDGINTRERLVCKHTLKPATAQNSVACSSGDLKQNINSIKGDRRRTMAAKYLAVIRRCVNLEAIVWDGDFGQMADTKFARVLEQNCPHLEHIEGPVRKDFAFKLNGNGCVYSPASFLDVFEPNKNITCYHVTPESINTDSGPLPPEDPEDRELKERLKPILKTVSETASSGNQFPVDKTWFDSVIEYVTGGSPDKPGPLDDNAVFVRNSNGMAFCREGLEHNVDYVTLPKDSLDQLEAAFGFIELDEYRGDH